MTNSIKPKTIIIVTNPNFNEGSKELIKVQSPVKILIIDITPILNPMQNKIENKIT
jgi:hypothetical protein